MNFGWFCVILSKSEGWFCHHLLSIARENHTYFQQPPKTEISLYLEQKHSLQNQNHPIKSTHQKITHTPQIRLSNLPQKMYAHVSIVGDVIQEVIYFHKDKRLWVILCLSESFKELPQQILHFLWQCATIFGRIVWLYYGVASVSMIDKIIGLFSKRALYKRLYSAKETYNFIGPTNRSHPI